MRKIYTIWKNIAEKIGNFQATILFSLLYFIVVSPIGVIVRLFKDFLNQESDPNWERTEDNVSTIDKLTLQ